MSVSWNFSDSPTYVKITLCCNFCPTCDTLVSMQYFSKFVFFAMYNLSNACAQYTIYVQYKLPSSFSWSCNFTIVHGKFYFTISLLFCIVTFHLYLSSFEIFFGGNINALNSLCLRLTSGNICLNFWCSFLISFYRQLPKLFLVIHCFRLLP